MRPLVGKRSVGQVVAAIVIALPACAAPKAPAAGAAATAHPAPAPGSAAAPAAPASTPPAVARGAGRDAPDVPDDPVALARFNYRGRGRPVKGGLPIGAQLHVYEVSCKGNEVTDTWRCAPSKGDYRKLVDSGQYQGLNIDTRRIPACFRVDVRHADAKIVKFASLLHARGNVEQNARRRKAILSARAAARGPLIILVHIKMHHAGPVCRCHGRDCCLGIRFTRAQIRAGHDSESFAAYGSQPIAVPWAKLYDLGSVGLYDVTPHAGELASLGTRGDWKAAVALATREARQAAALPPRARSMAWANLAVVAYKGRDMAALARAIAAIRAIGKDAHRDATSIAATFAPVLDGKAWLDVDPCAQQRAHR